VTDSADELRREYEVARALPALGAQWPVHASSRHRRPPEHRVHPTLWNRLDRHESTELPASAVGESLGQLHEAMNGCRVELLDCRSDIRRSRRTLQDRSRIPALAAGDRALLEEVFDTLLPTIEAPVFDSRLLHGEPHEGNRDDWPRPDTPSLIACSGRYLTEVPPWFFGHDAVAALGAAAAGLPVAGSPRAVVPRRHAPS
jgi:hypothetical protein